MKNIRKKLVTTISCISLMFTVACENIAGEGMANVKLTLGGSGPQASNSLLNLLAQQSYAAEYGDIKFCFKRLRFKLPEEVLTEVPQNDDSNPTELEDNIDFELGEVIIDPAGTELGDVVVPEGEYVRIEFDLENDCLSGNSVELDNLNGSYTSQDRITIKFDGDFVVTDDVQIDLPLEEIVNAMDSFSTASSDQQSISDEIKDSLEALSIRMSDSE